MSSKPPLTVGMSALADQLAADCRDELTVLSEAVKVGDQMWGESQSLANFIAWLGVEHPPAYVAALLVAAIRKGAIQ